MRSDIILHTLAATSIDFCSSQPHALSFSFSLLLYLLLDEEAEQRHLKHTVFVVSKRLTAHAGTEACETRV